MDNIEASIQRQREIIDEHRQHAQCGFDSTVKLLPAETQSLMRLYVEKLLVNQRMEQQADHLAREQSRWYRRRFAFLIPGVYASIGLILTLSAESPIARGLLLIYIIGSATLFLLVMQDMNE